MTLRRLGVLQWLGLLLGALVWAAQHVLGFGITQAECGPGGSHWGIANDVWEGSLLGASACAILLAEAAAVTVFLRTRDTTYDGPPPAGRLRFFAICAMPINAVVLMIVLLDGIGSIVLGVCRGS